MPTPMPDELFKPTEDELDDLPLTFGRWKGATPNALAKTSSGKSYLIWMYENVTGRPTCSRKLYLACGGTSKGQKQLEEVSKLEHAREKLEREAAARRKDNFGFDDPNDDIPF